MSKRWLRGAAKAAPLALILAGCGGGHASVPSAPIGLGVPYGYRTTQVWRGDLSGQSVQDVVVASEGPPVTSQGFHSRDLRVLVWDPLAHRWTVSFDAQKAFPANDVGDPGGSNSSPGLPGFGAPATAPLLDPKADVTFGSVRLVQLVPGKREQLAFSASMSYGGSGVPGDLAVVDFAGGIANVMYTWTGEGLRSWSVANHVLSARAEYWTPTDAHCCPITSYRFTVGRQKDGYVGETSDNRAWIGVVVRQVDRTAGLLGNLRVTGLADNSPAAGRLHVGDVLVNVLDAPKRPKGFPASDYSIFDKVILLHPGDVARLVVERDSRRIVVPVKLGSMHASFGTFLPKTDYTYAAL